MSGENRRSIRGRVKVAKHVSVTSPTSAFARLIYPLVIRQSKHHKEGRVFQGDERVDERRKGDRAREGQRKGQREKGDTNSADPTVSSGRFKSRLSGE